MGDGDIKKLIKELNKLKKDIELIKISLTASAGIEMSIGSFESGKYGEKDKIYFKERWKDFKKRAKKMGII